MNDYREITKLKNNIATKSILKILGYTFVVILIFSLIVDGFYNDTYIEKRTYDRGYGLISFENTPAIDDNETSMNLIFGYTLSK